MSLLHITNFLQLFLQQLATNQLLFDVLDISFCELLVCSVGRTIGWSVGQLPSIGSFCSIGSWRVLITVNGSRRSRYLLYRMVLRQGGFLRLLPNILSSISRRSGWSILRRSR